MFGSEKKDINFFYAYNLNTEKTEVSIKTFLIVILIEILLLSGTSLYIYSGQKMLEHKNVELNEKILKLSSVEKKVSTIKKEESLTKSKTKLKEKISSVNNSTQKAIIIFEKVLTADMSIDNINVDPEKISFTVQGNNEENFAQLIHNLETSADFENVHISSITSKEENGKRKASITAEIVRK